MITPYHLLIVLLLLGSLIAPAQAKSLPFSVETVRSGNGHTIIAHNGGAAPISAIISLPESQNLASDQRWPITTVIPPFSDKIVGVVYPEDSSSGYRFRTAGKARAGIVGALHDPSTLYRLPYLDGRSFTIGQAPGGKITTHNTPESRFAIDFPMPEGTLILAARDGTVIEVEDNYTEGGKESRLLTQANDICILHVDGTIATYAHLMPGGVSVKPGQQVTVGQLIGYAGSTGYSSGPHLHFVVSRLVESGGDLSDESVPVTLYVGNPPAAFAPQQGMKVTANYGGRADPYAIDEPIQLATKSVEAGSTLPDQLEPDHAHAIPSSEIKPIRIKNWGWLVGVLMVFLIIVIRGVHREKQKRQQWIDDLRHFNHDN